jgi:U3 small nucleolar ribonucleoprotein component
LRYPSSYPKLSTNTLDEFQASSKELEDELERELADTEKQQAELKEKIKRLEAEKDEWKVCQTVLRDFAVDAATDADHG